MGNENEILSLSVLQEQNQKIFTGISELTKAVNSLVEPLTKAAKEKDELTEKQKKEEEEQKMFKRFVRMMKEEGAIFARKQAGAGKVETAPGQKTVQSEKVPAAQQAVIQGQEKRRGDENEEEYPETKAEVKPEYEEEKAKKPEEETKACKPGEEEEKKANDEDEEYPEVAKLRKENESLKAQVTALQNSIPVTVEKAVEKKLQEMGWKSIGHTPVKIAGETMIFKGDKPVSREDLIQQLKKIPLAQLNDMNARYQAGELLMPEVK